MARNQVIAGDYNGKSVTIRMGLAYVDYLEVNKYHVTSYEVVDENYRKSATSAVGRAAVGAFLLGPVGLLAGIGAKNKGTHTLVLYWYDGKKSLIEVDDKIHKAIVQELF